MRLLSFIFTVCFLLCYTQQQANAASRIKDIVNIEGVRDNMLIGYGLVVGLNGTGDNLRNSPFTEQGLQDFLSRLGYNIQGQNIQTRNIAAVTITATLPAFSRSGSRFDVTVSTLGDSKSLEGGILLATPLLGPDGNVYAVSQGTVTITRASPDEGIGAIQPVPTVGKVPNGAIVEREIDFALNSMESVKLSLKNPDISTSRRISERINEVLGENISSAEDPGTVILGIPDIYRKNVLGLLADIEQIDIEPDQAAQVVIDESSGTVVISETVKIDTIAISQGNLVINVNPRREQEANVANNNFAGETAITADAGPGGPGRGLALVAQGANLYDLVNGMNALGVQTRDLITILKTIKTAGALHANIVVR